MTYRFIVEMKPTYLHAKGYGEQTEANTMQFAIDAIQACVANHMGRLLFEMCFTGDALSVASMYSVVVERSPEASMLKSIAYVDSNPEHAIVIAEFAETAARKRGVNVRLFKSIDEAASWLAG